MTLSKMLFIENNLVRMFTSLLEILNIEYKALENYLAELMIKREFWIYDFFNTAEEKVINDYLNDEKKQCHHKN